MPATFRLLARKTPWKMRNKQNAGDLDELQKLVKDGKADKSVRAAADAQATAQESRLQNERAKKALKNSDLAQVQAGVLGVDLSVQSARLRNQSQVVRTASRVVQNRNCVEIGGVWIDDGYNPKATVVTIKAMSNAYFRILEKNPQMREVFQLGNHLVWVTPSGTTLIIDQNDGQERLPMPTSIACLCGTEAIVTCSSAFMQAAGINKAVAEFARIQLFYFG